MLLSFDDANGATSTTDASNLENSMIFQGAAEIDTGQSAFGNSGSLSLNGTDAYIKCVDQAEFNLSNDSWTVEMHIKFRSVADAGAQMLMASVGPDTAEYAYNFYWGGDTDKYIRHAYSLTGTSYAGTFNKLWSPVADQWYHIAINRTGGDVKMFIDGVRQTWNIISNNAYYNNSKDLHIGATMAASSSISGYFDGWLDNIRITKGVGRYPDNGFTPPTEPYAPY